MESFLQWLSALANDADPGKDGFQAQWLYVVLCVVGPVAFGFVVAGVLTGIEKAFGIKLSAKGGH